ncbi:hypothetical protein BDW22DRAFT_1431209 [Trametopsis cervina]|nr:hypothetical protein BDW22DRAFT_1431209 [Trametopsis cervina]
MLGGLTPLGATFVGILLVLITAGVASAIYYSVLAPHMAQRRRRRAEEAGNTTVDSASPGSIYSPYLDHTAQGLITPNLAEEKNMYAEMFVKEDDSRDMCLTPPAPIYAMDKRGRLSTSTQDGIWWVV